ncbi:MAG: TetR/AcrR family transcriptional regulator [Hyphomicrobiales bacterium]|nr:TetR/AcrR family transcriptional regulator [Hyphomicrobiales bacterium]MCA1999185.1 TetR/AcrR family transcriptional regulator [Hyphomicrobiales bacterium]
MTGEPAESARARILAMAATELRQIGPQRLKISGIARRAGMSHANVYRHFDGKAGVLDALLGQWLRGLEARLQEIVDGPDPADDKLERFLATLSRAYAETRAQDRALFALLAEPFAGMLEPARHRRRVETWTIRIADEGIATRLFGGSDARRAAALALDLAHRFCDPAALSCAESGIPAGDGRRERVVRWAVRALTGRN